MHENEAEKRGYAFEVRAEEDSEQGSIILGRPIVYDTPTDIGGSFREIIERGALDHTDLTDVRFLVNHNTSGIPLARSRRNNGNSTMLLSVDDEGLKIRVSLDVENNSEARALYSAVQRGDVTGMSFMFWVDDEEWQDTDTAYPTRRIKSISSIVEVSAVTFPAYEATEITARSKQALENAKLALENARSGLDDTSLESELELAKAKTRTIYLGGLKNYEKK